MLALRVGRIWDIPIRWHWSFVLMVVLIATYAWYYSLSIFEVACVSAFSLAVVVSIFCHELGHAIVARRLAVRPLDMIISPIGGAVRFEVLPAQPGVEVAITLAGPIANLILTILLGSALYLIEGQLDVTVPRGLHEVTSGQGSMRLLIWANALLFALNLLPIYPLDGGKALRALLAVRVGRTRATLWVVLMSVSLLALVGIYAAWMRDLAVSSAILILLGASVVSAIRSGSFESLDG